MWRQLAAWAVVVGLAVAVPAVRAGDDKKDDDDHPHPVTKRVKDSKDHYMDGEALLKSATGVATKKIHDDKHKQASGFEAHAVMKDKKVGDVTVKDTKTGKNVKVRMVKSTKNPFKKPAKCGEEHINLGDDDQCGTQVSPFWYGWYYYNPYTTYYVYYWYPSTTVYYQPTIYPSVYDYTSYIVYY